MTASHVYTIELRFSGDELEPLEISSRLHLQPSNSFGRNGAQLGAKRRRPFWAYNGREEFGFQPEWHALEDGLAFLLNTLKTKKSEILLMSERFDGVWWCGHFQSSFDGGPTLSPTLLSELGSFGMPLSIDNYYSSE
ncbi:DUF4279 domain-containing protein [Roseateles chitinivorans]|uniref:DUF4279 domain-containing protein n=1 Tax=Roseateles chitinivorans TaxID=2917965 RepID=UPI003D671D44